MPMLDLQRNERELYGGLDIGKYGKMSNKELILPNEYKQNSKGSGNERTKAVLGLPFCALGQTICESIPYSPGTSFPDQAVNLAKNVSYKLFRAGKHKYGRDLLKNNIPVVNKFVQNGWSLLNLSRGLSRIEALYTAMDPSGNETPICMKMKGEVDPPLQVLDELGKQAIIEGRAESVKAEYITGKLAHPTSENDEATLAGVYAELTDGDILEKRLVDPTLLKPYYMDQEVWLTGQKGKRTLMGSSPNVQIVRYDRPSSLDFLKFHLDEDILYTFVDFPYGLVEGIFPAISEQRLYRDEVMVVTRNIRRWKEASRADGIDNPVGVEERFILG